MISLIVVYESLHRHVFVFCTWLPKVGIGVNANATTWGENPSHLNIFGLHEIDEILHDDIDAIFVKCTMIAEAEQIEFQALAFHHALSRNIADTNLCKVRLASDGAQRSELWTVELNPIVVFWVLIDEGF